MMELTCSPRQPRYILRVECFTSSPRSTEKAQADFERAYYLDPSQSLSIAAQGLALLHSRTI